MRLIVEWMQSAVMTRYCSPHSGTLKDGMNVVKDIWSVFAALLMPAYIFTVLPRQYGKHTTVVTYLILEHRGTEMTLLVS